jgi:hypothetical protein
VDYLQMEVVMAASEFEQARRDYEAGRISRRRFVQRLIGGGITAAAAIAFVDASTAMAAPGSGVLYGSPPGQGGTPPGQGGTPPPMSTPPPGLGGTPPGKGGTPPGAEVSRSKRG